MSARATIKRSLFFRLNDYLALSRTPHALLDLAGPGLAALLCLGTFPSPAIILIGFVTAFAGYTAVYALNDIVDYRVDRKIWGLRTVETITPDLDGLFVRHPLAQGLISFRAALTWCIFWSAVAVIGAWWLNPFCLAIFILAAFLETIYCALLKITWLRSVVSGFVKTSGPVAAVFAVNPDPPLSFVLLLFLWFFFWEIGGQNVPNDLSDMETDRDLQAKTIPVRFGIRTSSSIILLSLALAYVLSFALPIATAVQFNLLYPIGAGLCGLWLLLTPAMSLFLSHDTRKAFRLFNLASYYPLALLACLTISLLF
ncbi:MAG TPA: UbiA family prenyltransferase [Syntrophales bacterium]|nr:UbiA family prenyltransferase [Syntrophales bacterium]